LLPVLKRSNHKIAGVTAMKYACISSAESCFYFP
jgi:hypothetical protein